MSRKSFRAALIFSVDLTALPRVDRINAQIERLNADYSSAGFSFVLVNTSWVYNPDWFVNAYPGS